MSWLEIRAETPHALPRMHYSYMLCILDEYYNVNGQYKLDCPVARRRYEDVMITINKNNDIIMSGAKDSDIYVCYERGHLKHKFKRELDWVRSLSISNKNEIMVASEDERAVQIYSEEGNLKSTIKLPEGYEIRGVACRKKKIHISFFPSLKKMNWEPQRTFVRRPIMECLRSRPIQVAVLLL